MASEEIPHLVLDPKTGSIVDVITSFLDSVGIGGPTKTGKTTALAHMAAVTRQMRFEQLSKDLRRHYVCPPRVHLGGGAA